MYDPFTVPDKDPNFVYRWCNTDERAMLMRKAQGYEVVMDDAPELPSLTGAPIASGQVTRRRGTDLVLCKINRKHFEETIDARRRTLQAQHRDSLETGVAQTNDNAEAAMRKLGQKTKGLAFRTSPDPNF
jgi:hypothetical protein